MLSDSAATSAGYTGTTFPCSKLAVHEPARCLREEMTGWETITRERRFESDLLFLYLYCQADHWLAFQMIQLVSSLQIGELHPE